MKTNVEFYLKTENNNERAIEYFLGVKTDFGALIKFKKKNPILLLTVLEKKPNLKNVEIKTIKKKSDLYGAIKRYEKVGLNLSGLNALEYNSIKKELKGKKVIDISKEYMKKRIIKSEKEINKIKKSVEITEEIFKSLFNNFKKFKTEYEVVVFLKKKCIEYNVEPSFKPVVASGKNSSNPHYHPEKGIKLNKGFCIIDFGIIFKGYCSDMTRTIYLGKPSEKELLEYNKVEQEVYKLEKELKEGLIAKCSFKMIHALGHGIGLDVHEEPHLQMSKLKENMTIALEPAIYNSKFGIRIEDDYLIKKEKIIRFGKSTRHLKIIS